jgi:uncharacterized membrane protein
MAPTRREGRAAVKLFGLQRLAPQKKSSERLAFLDWTRGLGAFIMLQGHSFHSFLRPDLRGAGPYTFSQFVGGIAPAIFLFLTGVTFAFMMDGQSRQLAPARQRVGRALRRSGYLFLLAILFRLQMFSFGYPASPVSELFKVDILNAMGLATLVFVPMAVFSTFERIKLCAVLGVVIAVLSPLVSAMDANAMPWLLRAYFVPSFTNFGFFPWAAFVAFGMSAGSLLRTVRREDLRVMMQWSMLLGILLVMGGQYFSNLPYSLYPKAEFWLDSPGLVTIKLGVLLAILSCAYLWVNLSAGLMGAVQLGGLLGSATQWSMFRLLGRASLVVYWVHIELVYGRWFGFWKEQLDTTQVVLFASALIIAMVALAWVRINWRQVAGWFGPSLAPQPDPASGD